MIRLTTRRTFIIVLFIGLFAMAARSVDDPDAWWHLKSGEYIAAHQRVPHTDPFSYTSAGKRWIAHEWLTDLGMYELYRTTGFPGLILIFAAIPTLAFLLLYLRAGASSYMAGAVVLLGACAARAVPWGERPQMLSLLLASLWLLILERADKNPKLLWWTLPLTLLWVNLHAGFALGLAISAVFLLDACIGPTLRQATTQSCRFPALIFLFDLLLVPLNPNGLRMFSYPFETLRSPAMQNYIAEWASPNFHHVEYWPFLLLMLATFIILSCSPNSPRFRDLFLLLASLYASLVSTRMIPFFALIAVPIVAQRLGSWPRSNPRSNVPIRSLANGAIILAVAVVAAYHAGHVVKTQHSVETHKFPASAVAFLQANPHAGPIFNHYDWGGYLIWKLYPTVNVFIDGRADLYGDEVFKDFVDAYQFTDSWSNILDRRNIQTVLVTPVSPLATGLRANPGWRISYEDTQAVIFTAIGGPRASAHTRQW